MHPASPSFAGQQGPSSFAPTAPGVGSGRPFGPQSVLPPTGLPPTGPPGPSRRGAWIAAVLAVLVIAGVTVGIIALTSGGEAQQAPQSSPPPSFALTRTYPSLDVSTDTAKAQEQGAAKKLADNWAKAINARDEDGLRATMCSANGSMNLSALADQIEAGTMKVTAVSVSGEKGLAAIAFTSDGKDSEGSVPMARESGDWKICLDT